MEIYFTEEQDNKIKTRWNNIKNNAKVNTLKKQFVQF